LIPTILEYILALAAATFAAFLFGIVYGILMSPLASLRLPQSLHNHFNKVYLHLLWFLSGFLSGEIAFWVLGLFHLEISWIFVSVLFIPSAFLINSKKLRKPDSAAYFNFLIPLEDYRGDTVHYIIMINRIEAISRILGICFAAFVVDIL